MRTPAPPPLDQTSVSDAIECARLFGGLASQAWTAALDDLLPAPVRLQIGAFLSRADEAEFALLRDLAVAFTVSGRSAFQGHPKALQAMMGTHRARS